MRTFLRLASFIAFVACPVTARAQADAFSLEGLVVTATPTPRPLDAVANHVTVLSGADLIPYAGRSVGDLLRDVVGAEVVRGGSFGAVTSLFMRGGESDYTLVLVDGVQVNQAGGGFDFSSLMVENVERVEVLRGPASSLYGSDAVTGVIHVITRTGRGPLSGALTHESGSFGRRDWTADVQAGTDRVGYAVSVARRSTDGVLAFNNDHVSTALSGKARFRPDPRTELGVTFRLIGNEYHFPTDAGGAVVDRNAFTFGDATVAQARLERVVTDRVSVEALVGLHEHDGGFDDLADGPADTLGFFAFTSLNHFRRVTGEVRGHVELGGATLTGGVEREAVRQRSFTESESDFGVSSGKSASERSNRAAFLHASGALLDVAYALGGRVEDNERFGTSATWQAGLSWSVPGANGTRLRAAAGRAIKEPTFVENFSTGFAVGNPDLDPEHSRSWELGVEQVALEERLQVKATYFDQRFVDLIQFTFAPPNPGDPSFYNVAAATSRGLELDGTFFVGPASVGASWSWLDTEVQDSGFDSGPGATFVNGEPLLRRPESSWTLRAAATIGTSASAWVRLTGVGERPDRDFSTFPATPIVLPAYRSLGVGAEWSLPAVSPVVPDLSVTVRGENLLNDRFEEVLGFESPGRALYVGVRAGLGG